jgi:hypothetical protein
VYQVRELILFSGAVLLLRNLARPRRLSRYSAFQALPSSSSRKAPHFSLLLSLALPVFALLSEATLPAAKPLEHKLEQLFFDEFERAELGE